MRKDGDMTVKSSANPSPLRAIGGIQTPVFACFFIFLLLVPVTINNAFVTSLLTTVFIYMILGQSWNVLGGYTGLFSLGQNMFYGITAYAMVLFTSKLGLHIALGFLCGLGLNCLLALLIGLVSSKVKELFFAVLTLAMAQIMLGLVNTWYGVTNGTRGAALSDAFTVSGTTAYYVGLAMVLLSVAIMIGMTRSKMGNYLIAIRENEELVKSLGVNSTKWCIVSAMLSALIASLASVVMVLHISIVYPNATFAFDVTTKILVVTIIGGKGDIRGPIYGSAIIIIDQLLRGWLGGQYAGLPGIIYGLFMVIIVLALPGGVAGAIHHGGAGRKAARKKGEAVAVQS